MWLYGGNDMNNSSVLSRSPIVYPAKGIKSQDFQRFSAPATTDLNLLGFEQVFAPHGSTLVCQGADLDCAFYILSGWVLEEEVTCEGEVAWADIILRGEVAGLNCVASNHGHKPKQPVATATISALTDVFAVRVPRRRLDRLNEDDKAFARLLHDTLRRQSAHLHDQLVALSAKTANDRVLLLLKSLKHRAQIAFGTCAHERLPVSQVVLARLANVSVVHMNRIAQKLRQEGVLDWSHEGVRFLTERPSKGL
jgi:CRP-like cAMP-binding protein